jgi:hypothetical protein
MREVEGRGRSGARAVSAGSLVAVVAGSTLLSGGCSLANDATTAVTAPLTALPATDVVVETNLQTELQAAQAAAATGQAPSGGSFVAGPSSGPSVTSVAAPQPGAEVLVAYNNVTRDCLGILYLAAAPASAVLGESGAGTYYFTAPSTPSGACTASGFAALGTAPAGWPAGDPSSAGFPPA